MYQVLFNPFSGNGQGEAVSKKLPLFFPESALHYHKMTEIKDYPTLFPLSLRMTSSFLSAETAL